MVLRVEWENSGREERGEKTKRFPAVKWWFFIRLGSWLYGLSEHEGI